MPMQLAEVDPFLTSLKSHSLYVVPGLKHDLLLQEFDPPERVFKILLIHMSKTVFVPFAGWPKQQLEV